MKDFEEAVRIAPEEAITHYWIGVFHHHMERYDQAIECYNESIRLDPDRPEPYNNRATSKAFFGDFYPALDDVDHALNIKPVFDEAYFNRAIIRTLQGFDDQAQIDADRAIELGVDRHDVEQELNKLRDWRHEPEIHPG
jgi:tetratricopeptide (TPR) repeat protein